MSKGGRLIVYSKRPYSAFLVYSLNLKMSRIGTNKSLTLNIINVPKVKVLIVQNGPL